jgi:hypothetical protein
MPLHAEVATLIEPIQQRPGVTEWRVRMADGSEAQAVAYPALSGDLTEGEKVWLNVTAVELGLGTGGLHYILAPLHGREQIGAQADRGEGHLIKLRYTALQHAVLSVEEETSPHRDALSSCGGLDGMPVVAAELHSAAMAAVVAARACGARRVVYVMTDGAALPIAFSRLVARLRSDGVLTGTITAGQSFGGDLEAVTPASALTAAHAVFGADLVVVSQGPGNAGTGTPLGFSGLAQAEHLNTAAALGGRAVAVPRVSFADPRPRHQGLSHHTATILGRLTLARVAVGVPALPEPKAALIRRQMEDAGILARQDVRMLPVDDLLSSLHPHREMLTTMGRTIDQDPECFLAACAAVRLALDSAAGIPWGSNDSHT